jgi:hypothetical protein
VNRANTPKDRLVQYRHRWLARYNLAQLSLQPEGTPFVLIFPGGRRQTVRLISPPDLVVFRDEAGRWQRRQRNHRFDRPQVNSDGFYLSYLALNFLPPWFFRASHLAILNDTLEARLLGVDVPAALQEGEPSEPTEQQQVRTRSMLAEVHRRGGGTVNPTQIPAGLGRWEWLDSSDRDTAEANGFGHSFEDITDARAAGALSHNENRQDVPSVVWYPDPQYLNPSSQPAGPGHWAFLTSGGNDGQSAESWASLNLGLTAGMSNHPTASQIFRLRQQYLAQGREDITAQISLVWIPGEDASESEGDDPVLQPLAPVDEKSLFYRGDTSEEPEKAGQEELEESESEQEEENEQQPTHGVLGPGISPSDFDPTNGDPGGATDQTARLCPPRYYTFRIGGRIVTMDRARPRTGKVETHKTCVFTKAGWQQHSGHIEIDWSNKKTIASLARWRDQAAKRNGWPVLRTAPRVVYANDEKAWVKAQVHRRLDAGRDYDIAVTNLGFQKLFGQRRLRTELGIGSLMLRIKRAWQKTHAPSALMSGQLAQEDGKSEEDEGLDEEDGEGDEDGEGEEQEQASDQGEDDDREEAALRADIEALQRLNEAEDEDEIA